MCHSICNSTPSQSPANTPPSANSSIERLSSITFLVLAIVGTLMIALGVINFDTPHYWIPLDYPVPTALIAIGVISMVLACGGCAYSCIPKSTSTTTPTSIAPTPSTAVASTPALLPTPKNPKNLQAGENQKPETDPLKLISKYSRQLNLSSETQEHLKYLVSGILDTQGWFAKHSESAEKFNLLVRQFTEVFSLIEQKDDPQNTLLRNFLCELDIAYRDNKVSDDTVFYLCFPAMSKLLLNWIRVLQKPDTQEIETALPFFFEEFKIHAIEMMILDQRDLHVLLQSGKGEFLGFFESVKRLLILEQIYPELRKLPSSHSAQPLSGWPSKRMIELKTIFPMNNLETADQYAQRAYRLGQIPLEVMKWPMHDSNKFSLAIELLREELKLPHTDLAIHNREEMLSPEISPLLESLESYYCTKDLFIEYVQTWIGDASATQLQQKAFKYVWVRSEKDELFTPDKLNLSSAGIFFLIQSLQKEGHFDCSPFSWSVEFPDHS